MVIAVFYAIVIDVPQFFDEFLVLRFEKVNGNIIDK